MREEPTKPVFTPLRSVWLDNTSRISCREIKCLEEIKSVCGSEKSHLVLFDIDNTIIKTAQQLGSDQWFEHTLEQRKAQGDNIDEAVQHTLPLYHAVQRITQVELIEDSTPQLINELRNDGHMVFGFTARGHELAEATRRQLQGAHINFGLAFDEKNKKTLLNDHPVYFDKGIIYCDGRSKGECLFNVLAYLRDDFGQRPDAIVFVDDKLSNVKAVTAMATQLQIPCTGFHFTRLANELTVEPHIISEQEKNFNNLLTNQQADDLHVAKRIKTDYPGLSALFNVTPRR